MILSPEAYKDSKKLRKIILSSELAHKRHVTIVDKAHCITTGGSSDFRKDFEHIGDMRVHMPDPDAPMCAVTAMLSSKIKHGIIQSLHIKPDYLDINLGCWRPNLRSGVQVMNGGVTAYSEICRYFDSSVAIDDTEQALIFVEDARATHLIARELRIHFKLSGDEAINSICAYHDIIDEPSNRRMVRRLKKGKSRIMVTSEALNMVNFFRFYFSCPHAFIGCGLLVCSGYS